MSRPKTRGARSSSAGDQIGPRLLGKPVAGKLPNPGVAHTHGIRETRGICLIAMRPRRTLHVAIASAAPPADDPGVPSRQRWLRARNMSSCETRLVIDVLGPGYRIVGRLPFHRRPRLLPYAPPPTKHLGTARCRLTCHRPQTRSRLLPKRGVRLRRAAVLPGKTRSRSCLSTLHGCYLGKSRMLPRNANVSRWKRGVSSPW